MLYLKLFESFKNSISFYHGSIDRLANGTLLKPSDKSYTRNKEVAFLEDIMEKYRPHNKLSRYDSIFLVDDIDNIDGAGGSIDYIYEVEVHDNILLEKSDLAWYTEIEMTDDIEEQKEYALNYWNSIQYHNLENSLWEYRVPSALITKLIEDNS